MFSEELKVFFNRCSCIFIHNSKSKQNKKSFVDIIKYETCAKCQQKILNFMVAGACQSFHFFRQITWFLGNNKILSKFKYRICITEFVLSNY